MKRLDELDIKLPRLITLPALTVLIAAVSNVALPLAARPRETPPTLRSQQPPGPLSQLLRLPPVSAVPPQLLRPVKPVSIPPVTAPPKSDVKDLPSSLRPWAEPLSRMLRDLAARSRGDRVRPSAPVKLLSGDAVAATTPSAAASPRASTQPSSARLPIESAEPRAERRPAEAAQPSNTEAKAAAEPESAPTPKPRAVGTRSVQVTGFLQPASSGPCLLLLESAGLPARFVAQGDRFGPLTVVTLSSTQVTLRDDTGAVTVRSPQALVGKSVVARFYRSDATEALEPSDDDY